MSFWERIVGLAGELDRADYYQLLGVDAAAPGPVIQERFHALVARLHPDRHARERDPERQRALTRVYARVAEAYRVLADPTLRQAYDQALASGQRTLPDGEGDARGAAGRRPDPSTPLARQLYDKAQAALRAGDDRGARQQLELARHYEPGSQAIAAALAALERPAPPPAPVEGPQARRHPRYRGAVPVKVRLPSWKRVQVLHTRDMSRGGLFLKTDKPLDRGLTLALTMVAPDGTELELPAQVARVVPPGGAEPAGMGLRFLELPGETLERIEALLEQQFEPQAPPPERRTLRPPGVPATAAEPPSPGLEFRPRATTQPPEPREPAPAPPVRARRLLASDLFGELGPNDSGAMPVAVAAAADPRAARELIDAGRYAEARRHLEAALEITPQDRRLRAALHLALGHEAKQAGAPDRARQHFDAALALDPQCEEAIVELRR